MNATTTREITKAIEALGGRTGWVRVTDLLEALADRVDVGPVQLTEYALDNIETVTTLPESNQKALTFADRDAALWIGGQDRHLIKLG